MLEQLKNLKNSENSVAEFCEAIRQGMPSAAFGVTESFKYFLAANIESPVLYVVKDAFSVNAAVTSLSEISRKKTVGIFPKEETLLSVKAFSKDGTYSRIKAAYEIDEAKIIVTSADALMQPFPKKISAFTVKKGEETGQDKLIGFLAATGYERTDFSEAKGTFAVRGDVLDIFPVNCELPIRIDFFGDEIESVKTFDPQTRKTVSFSDSATILQAAEFLFSAEDIKGVKQALREELSKANAENYDKIKTLCEDAIAAAEAGGVSEITQAIPLSSFFGDVFSRLPENCVIVFDEPKRAYDTATFSEKEFNERFSSLYLAGATLSFAKKNHTGVDALKEKLKDYRLCALQTTSADVRFFNPLKIINPKVSGVADYFHDLKEFYADVRNWTFGGYKVYIFAGSLSRAEKTGQFLAENGVDFNSPDKKVKIFADKLSAGFIFHEEKTAVIGCKNLYTAQPAVKPKTKKQSFFTAPETGDFCVHEVHGVGKVLGTKKITTLDGTKDYVAVQYAGGDVLYVPVEQMDILTRYLGSEKKPKLSKIGGQDFDRIKRSVKAGIKKMSFDLKKLYGERKEKKGFVFHADNELENAFDAAFPFEETADQISADNDIRKDMTSDKVMDRLICGDVGFGKTEVAFRAVFRAAINGKQAAMLAPTTILTEQHYATAKERFEGFGVRIAVLNRFRTAAEQKKILNRLAVGEIDFIIGTHRLLSKDVAFKDLGLLILDEEQRFGVEHKEKIKLLKSNVDTLTLTATPIPRTLHMSLAGIRDISVINTPPKKRLPVQTFVTEESDALIADAVKREINRGGQAFILYNRVESINSFAAKVQSLLPDVRITVCHGRMDESAIENGVMKFYGGESDLLISTTIIENGIDMPRANTLIVIDADRLGLSTLYQLKGRVGRSDRLAYAYFTFKREKVLSGASFERLNAIIEFTEMGSGIKIAMRDLEIRGAGNVLGAQQHGHMDKIGYELYSKLLREELSGKEEKVPDLDVRLSAYIPETYIESDVARMGAYKEIAEINSEESEKDFISWAESSYGPIPQEVKNLIDIAVVKFTAMKISAACVTVKRGENSIGFDGVKPLDNPALLSALEKYKGIARITVSANPKIEFAEDASGKSATLQNMRKFLALATA